MTKILIFKEELRKLYSKHSMYINPIIKFIATVFTLLIVNHYTGYAGIINNPVVAIIVAAVCALLPVNLIVVVTSFFTIANIYYISMEMAIVAVMLYLIMYIFYFRFSSKYGYLILFVQIFMFIKIPYIIPLFVGIALNPGAAIAMIFGIVIFFMLKAAGSEGVEIANGNAESGVDCASEFLRNIIQNKEMLVMIIAFTAAVLVVYVIKRMSADHSSTIAIISGGFLQMAIIFMAAYVSELEEFSPIWLTGILSLLSIVIMYFGQYFVLAVNYARTEYVQFEDDDYYYYVKAVPKVKVNATDVKVKHINSKRR